MTWPNIEYRECDWAEDASHENGNYNNVCVHCNRVFIGHKRRVCCKVCDRTPPTPVSPEMGSVMKKIEDLRRYESAGDVAEELADAFDDALAMPLMLPRDNPYPKQIVNLDDPAQVDTLRGQRIAVYGTGAATFVEKLVAKGLDAFVFEPGKTKTSELIPELKSSIYMLEAMHPKTKQKAQWKTERNGRR